MKWKLVPEEPTEEMGDAGIAAWKAGRTTGTYIEDCYKAMLAAAPNLVPDSMTKEEAKAFQDWKGMDGATAFLLIEPRAEGWADMGMMMDAWLEANKS